MSDLPLPPTPPSLRRPSLAIGIAIGLLAGSLLTALLTAGDAGGTKVTTATTLPGATSTPADGTPPAAEVSAGTPGASTGASGGAGGLAAGRTSTQAGARATSKTGATGATGTVATAACAGSPTNGVRGVTNTSIKIGFGLTDIRAFEPVLGPAAVLGDQKQHINAHLDALRKAGILPVCGRDIEPVFREYQILDPSQSRSVCQAFINDDKVFAVFTEFLFRDPNCVTQENKTFLMDRGLGATNKTLADSGGRFFIMDPPAEVALRLWVGFAHMKGYLPGKNVGVYYNTSDAEAASQYDQNVVGTMKKLGYNPTVVTSNTPASASGQADPNDSVAVQRFKAANVQVVFLQADGGFYDEAQRQGFRPLYVRYGSSAKDATTSSRDPSYFQSVGVSWERANEGNSGLPVAPAAEACMKHVDQAGMQRPHREWAEWDASLLNCDYINLIVRAMQLMGNNVTTDRMVQAFNTFSTFDSALEGDMQWTPQKHWGANRNREVRYVPECKCWRIFGSFEPLYLP